MTAFELVLSSRVDVAAPPATVWTVLTDVATWTRYNPVVVAVDVAPPTWEVGARLATVLRLAGRRVAFDVAVTEVDPPRRLAWSSRRWTVTGTRTFRITPTARGAVIEDHKRFACAWFPVGWIYPRRVIRRMSEAWLAAVRDEAERRVTA